jgi:trimeric autotransporter adhesin
MVLTTVDAGTGDVVGDMTHDESRSDAEILESVRRGDLRAYVELYERHVAAARRLALSQLRNQADADDVVAEVFASILAVIQRGKGPSESFDAYLMTSVRHECSRARRRRRMTTQVTPTAKELVAADEGGADVDPYASRDEVDVLHQAFQRLPPASRQVLWRTEVEGQSHQAIADVTGSTPQAVAAQAMRARRALIRSYLQRHLTGGASADELSPACSATRAQLADLVRHSLSSRRQRRLEAHLSTCPSCRDSRDELDRLNQQLRTVPALPLTGAAGLLRIGLRARILGLLGGANASTVAVTGLIAMSVVVPVVMAQHSTGGDQVTAVTESVGQSRDHQSEVIRRSGETPSAESVDTRSRGRSSVGARGVGDHAAPPLVTTTTVARPVGDKDLVTPTQKRTKRATPPNDANGPPATTHPITAPPTPATSISVPAVSFPPITVPAITVPPVTAPPITVPAITVPPVTAPPITVPPITVPPVTAPPITVPAITVPPVTAPPITVPPITVPPVTAPPITVPAITVPPVTAPPITVPAITVPAGRHIDTHPTADHRIGDQRFVDHRDT